MRSGLSQVQEQALMRATPDIMPQPTASPTAKEIPYDYVATFKLKGEPGNRVQEVINISVEGTFVAVAIGYSFIPAKLPTEQDPTILSPADLHDIEGALSLVSNLIQPIESSLGRFAQCLLMRLCGIHFKYSIIDSGTGRELQNKAIHSIAGLGEATGERPFRPLAKPMLFMPRSTIRIEIEELSKGPIYIGAELFIVLHGYKILGNGV